MCCGPNRSSSKLLKKTIGKNVVVPEFAGFARGVISVCAMNPLATPQLTSLDGVFGSVDSSMQCRPLPDATLGKRLHQTRGSATILSSLFYSPIHPHSRIIDERRGESETGQR